jgi:amino acid transporter
LPVDPVEQQLAGMSELRKSLGFPTLIAMGTAGVLGTSWIYTNGEFFAKYGAGGEIFGLIIGIALAAFVALAYAELAGQLPRAGGEMVYGYLAFNRTVGFVAGWLLIGAYISSLAFYVAATGDLLARILPELATVPVYSIAGSTVYLPELSIGIVLAIVICAINAWGMSLGAWTQLLLFITMLVIGAALAIAGFGHGSVDNFWPPYESDQGVVGPTLRFVLPAMTFVTGFSLVAILAEDSKLSPRRIGSAVLTTVVFAGIFYGIVLLASAWVIPWTETAGLDQGAIDSYMKAGFPALSWGAYAIALLGLLTSFLALFVATSRIMLAMARAGLFPRLFAKTSSKRGTPINALLFTLVLSVVLGLLGQSALTWFLDTGGVFIGFAWFIAVWSMYRMRRHYPNARRPYFIRVSWLPGIGAVAAVLIIILTLLPMTGMSLVWPYEYLILAAWLLLGVIIYVLGPRRQDDTQALQELLGPEYDKFLGQRNSSGFQINSASP